MTDISKQRHGRTVYDDLSETNQEKAHEAMRERRGKPVEFIAPGKERKWRARDLVDIHWKLTGIEPPSESYCRIISCIIGHANPRTGTCYPSHATIAIETGYSVKTVQRVIDWWCEQKFLTTESRGLAKALAYHPQWDVFELHWIAIAEDIATQKESARETPVSDRVGL